MNNENEKAINALVKKAEEAQRSEDALRFSQAACNVANAMITLANVKEIEKERDTLTQP